MTNNMKSLEAQAEKVRIVFVCPLEGPLNLNMCCVSPSDAHVRTDCGAF